MPRASTPTTSSPDEAGASSGVPAPKQPTVGDVIGNWLGEKKAKVDSWVSEKHDDAIRTSTNNILDRVGPFVMRSIEDPYLPDFLKRALRAAFDKVWNEVRGELLNDMLRSYGWDSVYYEARLHRLRKWRDAPRLCKCCRPGYGCCGDPGCCGCVLHFFRALRARFLYADQPADGTAWKVLRDPLGLLIFTLKLHVATSVATFAIFFVLMDKRDEAQLVRFILKFKSVMFLTSGLVPAAFLGMSVHACLVAVDQGQPQLCIEHAASSSPYFPLSFVSELVRLSLLLFAFCLLVGGYAVGGDAEIAALEQARLELNATPRDRTGADSYERLEEGAHHDVITAHHNADEVVEEVAVAATAPPPEAAAASASSSSSVAASETDPPPVALKLPAAKASSAVAVAPLQMQRATSPSDATGVAAGTRAPDAAVPSPRLPGPAEIRQTLERHRSAWGAERRMGGALPYFLAYDLLVLLGLSSLWWYLYVDPNGGLASVDVSSPIFWSSLYNLKMVYGLASFPFLVFELPFIGPALTKCRDTAYDQYGQLVVRLTKLDVVELYEGRHGTEGAYVSPPHKDYTA